MFKVLSNIEIALNVHEIVLEAPDIAKSALLATDLFLDVGYSLYPDVPPEYTQMLEDKKTRRMTLECRTLRSMTGGGARAPICSLRKNLLNLANQLWGWAHFISNYPRIPFIITNSRKRENEFDRESFLKEITRCIFSYM